MPPGERRRSFGGGNLLGEIRPIPDDDEPEKGDGQSTAAPVPEPEPEPSTPIRSGPPVTPTPAQEPVPPAPVRKRGGRPLRRRRPGDEAPTTVRLSDEAGAALWEGYVRAKQEDPFLAYVDYASAVVTDGLDRERRRRGR